MIDKNQLPLLLENMERAAEEVLRHDAAFFEALYALKSEIDHDLAVRSAMRGLQAAGKRAFTSFVPRVNIRIRTENGVLALRERPEVPCVPANDEMKQLADELRKAAASVIERSIHRRELNAIINEAIGSNSTFEGIASEIQRAGYNVIVSVDFSAYTTLQGARPELRQPAPMTVPKSNNAVPSVSLSNSDVKFLKNLGIRADI